ncbi:tudor domain-containing protein 7A [Hippoglossus hippoglossus]|uniref:tudor domain-containing protein 7A n=1 Tax=Hippoglossus hippoglossus TaxID=8267 RepID=UPI00148DAE36|nr:tudor domain-containing protein 7A [Hippoglossus hippoglossus]XP_034454407.1 tudor domain-containing protein 7A [Hippoglossus hippoglossus]
MSDSEAIHKMLRSVLQSSKGGVSINSLQSEYRSLCGQNIPLKKLGFSELEDFLRSIPSVVQLEYRMGELKCFATVCRETAHIAELVARQRSSKKSGRSQVVNCKMRFKPSNPLMLNLRPRSSLRQPSAGGASNCTSSRSRGHGGFRGCSASGDYRQRDQKLSYITPVEHRQPAPQPAVRQCVRKETSFANCQKPEEKPPEQASRPNLSKSSLYDVRLMQSRITHLLKKYCSGLWMSKISEVYSKMFSQSLHPQVLKDLEKWTHICMVEQTSCNNRADRLVYPPLLQTLSVVPRSTANNTPLTSPTNSEASTTRNSPCPSTPEEPTSCSKSPLVQPTFIFPPQPAAASSGKQLSSVTLRSPVHNPALAPQIPPRASRAAKECKDNHNIRTTQKKNTPPGHDILPLSKLTLSSTSDSAPFSTTSADTVSAEVRQRIKELLTKYSQGLWAHALPKLFIETYKTPFPENVLDHLPLLLDMCSVEYPIPHDKNRAILYISDSTDMEATDGQARQQCSCPFPSGLEVPMPKITPGLPRPSEQYPSVLVTDAQSSNAVTIRYVGENYSNAQEAMEDAMCSFYSQGSTHRPLSNPLVGQLIAVRGEGGDELARAQVTEVMAPNKVKVYYVDYGFSVETSGSNLLELHQDFLSLPFQATNVRLAGLETLSSHPLVQSSLDKLVVGKILLMETLEPCQQIEGPLVVLYDTSQDDDININSTCLKSLQDNTMNNPLTLQVTQQDMCVTKVSPDGIIYCQLPSRGTAKLNKLLEKTEAFFIFQMTSESLVSRPFSGKFCLASYKGKWSRVEITNMYNNRVLEILFIDLGIPATVEVTALREIPPPLLKDFTIIPPQAIKCRLADLEVPEGEWSPEAVQWMEEAVMSSEDCKMKIMKLDKHKGALLVYMYLFVGVDSQELHKSINHELAQSEQWQKLTTQNNYTVTSSDKSMDTGLDVLVEKLTLNSSVPSPFVKTSNQPCYEADSSLTNGTTKNGKQPLPLPPLLELPQPGQNMDVFVPVACHPRYFVLQPWQDLHKLTVLMGEMIFYYNQHKTTTPTHIQRGDFCAARIDKNWHRVQVKDILANGLVSLYELDYGKHEHINSNLIRPLIEEFRQLPFQAVTAQLAGVKKHQWSEEASILFRNHVEKKALVAQVVSVHEGSEVKGKLREPRLTVYLVDTTLEEKDLWIHTLMVDMDVELSSAA